MAKARGFRAAKFLVIYITKTSVAMSFASTASISSAAETGDWPAENITIGFRKHWTRHVMISITPAYRGGSLRKQALID